ncbi:MAG: tetratricopeptide repeat protein [Bacteroidia bacterium]|jgi:tetratricopeptide (TPR) repeat protein|nr:tetratricopeptide repeat protein [Bacteroidia bacterium]
MNSKFAALLFSSVLLSCSQAGPDEKEMIKLNLRSDSLSLQLNSPDLKAVNKKLVDDPNNAELYDQRANIYLKLKLLEEALNDSKLAVRIDSSIVDYYLSLVDIYFAMNNTRMVKETLLRMEKKFPDNQEVVLKLAELYFLVKQYQDAITYINKSLRIDESQSKAYHLKGNVYLESGDTAKALSSFQTAIEQDNAFVDAYYDLGMLYASKKDPLAFDYYANALRLNPAHEQSLYARAKLYQDLEKYDEAIKGYTAMLQTIKTNELCHYNLGAIYLEVKNEYQLALEQFTKAIELNSNYIEAYLARGYTYAKLKDIPSAKADYNMCLKIQPNYELAITGLNSLK